MDVILYHNPACETSRNVLALIRNAGVEPRLGVMYTEMVQRRGYSRGSTVPGILRPGLA